MILSNSRKVIYIASPHTGSTFIVKNFTQYDTSVDYKFGGRDRNTFNPDQSQSHLFLSDAIQYIKHPLEEYTIVVFVRNPIDYFISDYTFMERRRLGNGKITKMVQEFIDKTPTIDERVVDHIEWTKKLSRDLYKLEDAEEVINSIYIPRINCMSYQSPQVHFLKFENFHESVCWLYDKLGKHTPDLEEKENYTRPWQNREIKQETRDLIYSEFRKDFDFFGYTP